MGVSNSVAFLYRRHYLLPFEAIIDDCARWIGRMQVAVCSRCGRVGEGFGGGSLYFTSLTAVPDGVA